MTPTAEQIAEWRASAQKMINCGMGSSRDHAILSLLATVEEQGKEIERADSALAEIHDVLRWLNGEVQDSAGLGFGDRIAGEGAFWWRRKIRPLLHTTSPIGRASLLTLERKDA